MSESSELNLYITALCYSLITVNSSLIFPRSYIKGGSQVLFAFRKLFFFRKVFILRLRFYTGLLYL